MLLDLRSLWEAQPAEEVDTKPGGGFVQVVRTPSFQITLPAEILRAGLLTVAVHAVPAVLTVGGVSNTASVHFSAVPAKVTLGARRAESTIAGGSRDMLHLAAPSARLDISVAMPETVVVSQEDMLRAVGLSLDTVLI